MEISADVLNTDWNIKGDTAYSSIETVKEYWKIYNLFWNYHTMKTRCTSTKLTKEGQVLSLKLM